MRAKLVGLVCLALAAILTTQGPSRAQEAPVDPDQLTNQLAKALARVALDRPLRLQEKAKWAAEQSQFLAQELGPRFQAGQGPNGGGVTPELRDDVTRTVADAAVCPQLAQANLTGALQDLGVLKQLLGDNLDIDEVSPETAQQLLQWMKVVIEAQRHRQFTAEQCVDQALVGVGRLRGYRALYPN